jgi:hypothetical protein
MMIRDRRCCPIRMYLDISGDAWKQRCSTRRIWICSERGDSQTVHFLAPSRQAVAR